MSYTPQGSGYPQYHGDSPWAGRPSPPYLPPHDKFQPRSLSEEFQQGSSPDQFQPRTSFDQVPRQIDKYEQFDSPPTSRYYEESIHSGSASNKSETPRETLSAQSYLGDPLVTNMAMHYGTKLVGSGKKMVDKEIERYFTLSKVKYYFAVDNMYVLRKLGFLLFPFTNSDWSLKYFDNMPLPPRFDINAPDLYIPTMAYVTYVLVAGLLLGTQNRFTPEMLGIFASQAMAWVVVEVIIQQITLYITSLQSNIKAFDLLSFSGYKFVGIILSVLMSLLLRKEGYYIALVYTSISLAFFQVRALKFQLLSEKHGTNLDEGYNSPSKSVYGDQNKRRMYFVLSVAICQPILMWWLSCHLVT